MNSVRYFIEFLILLIKLLSYGILWSYCNWFKSYLNYGDYVVVINGNEFKLFKIFWRVLQEIIRDLSHSFIVQYISELYKHMLPAFQILFLRLRYKLCPHNFNSKWYITTSRQFKSWTVNKISLNISKCYFFFFRNHMNSKIFSHIFIL